MKRKREKYNSENSKKRNLTFIIFAVIIFISSIVGYALMRL